MASWIYHLGKSSLTSLVQTSMPSWQGNTKLNRDLFPANMFACPTVYPNISQYIPSDINDILGSIIPETNHQPTGLSIAAIRACVSALTCEKKKRDFYMKRSSQAIHGYPHLKSWKPVSKSSFWVNLDIHLED